MTRNADNGPSAAMPSCPVCGKPASPVARLRPFCSTRCADVDLGRWLTGQYRIAGTADDDDEMDDHETTDGPPPDSLA